MLAEEVIRNLGLEPHPEGGFFKEVYRSGDMLDREALPERYGAERTFGTSIYYLLTADTFSRMHKLESDEIFHFYLGDPVEMLNLYPDGYHEIVYLGQKLDRGMHLQHMVPRGIWQGAHLAEGGEWALLGTTVAPGFDFADYSEGEYDNLLQSWPKCREIIEKLV